MGIFDKFKKTIKQGVSSGISFGKKQVKEIGKKMYDAGATILGKKANELLNKGLGEVKKHTSSFIGKNASMIADTIDKAENIYNSIRENVPLADKIFDKVLEKVKENPTLNNALNAYKIVNELAHKLKDGTLDPQEIADTIVDNGMQALIQYLPDNVIRKLPYNEYIKAGFI